MQIKGIDPDLSEIAEHLENERSDNEDVKHENLILSSPEDHETNLNKLNLKTNDAINEEIKQMIEKCDGAWKCQLCGKTTDTNSAIRAHAESHITGIRPTCHLCDKTFTTRPNLRSHISNMHKGVFDCDKCGKSGMNRQSSQYHMKRHHDKN